MEKLFSVSGDEAVIYDNIPKPETANPARSRHPVSARWQASAAAFDLWARVCVRFRSILVYYYEIASK
jgi:hypothetical protein